MADYRSVEAFDGNVKPIAFFSFHHEVSKTCGIGVVVARLRDDINQQVPTARVPIYFSRRADRFARAPALARRIPRSYCPFMSLSEIEKAVDELPPNELVKLAAYIARRDKLAWDRELEEDFSPGGKHEKVLEKIDAEIDAGNFTPLP